MVTVHRKFYKNVKIGNLRFCEPCAINKACKIKTPLLPN